MVADIRQGVALQFEGSAKASMFSIINNLQNVTEGPPEVGNPLAWHIQRETNTEDWINLFIDRWRSLVNMLMNKWGNFCWTAE